MIDFEGMLRVLESQVAQIDCPACSGPMAIRVGEIQNGRQLRCDGCGFETPLEGHAPTEAAMTEIKKDLAIAFKRAFRAIEDYTKPPESF